MADVIVRIVFVLKEVRLEMELFLDIQLTCIQIVVEFTMKRGYNLLMNCTYFCEFQEFVECMYLKSVDTSISDAKPSHIDIISWVDQAYKMLKSSKVSIKFLVFLFEIHVSK